MLNGRQKTAQLISGTNCFFLPMAGRSGRFGLAHLGFGRDIVTIALIGGVISIFISAFCRCCHPESRTNFT
jgi:hypothetical protein